MNPLSYMKKWLSGLPNKKHHVEFITALLSVPVLLTVVYLNYLSIQEKRHEDENKPSPTQVVTIIREKDDDPTPTPNENNDSECIPGVGDASIVSPEDSSTTSENPLEIDIAYEPGDYCAVVWSYRINDSQWSDYSDKDIVIYNMPSGEKKLALRVKSIVNGQEKRIETNFTYRNTQEVPTPTVTPSSTATPTPTTPDIQGATTQ